MKILMFFVLYNPDGGPAAPLATSLAENLVVLGNEVTVICAVPHFPSGRVADAHRGFSTKTTVENGVKVIRIPLPSINRKKFVLRMLQFTTYQLFATFIGFRVNADVVLAHTPALSTFLPYLFHGLLRKNRKTIYSIADVYPDVGINSGLITSPLVNRFIESIEKILIRNSGSVRIVSKSFVSRIHELGAKMEDIRLIYDWVETDQVKPMSKFNNFSEQYNLSDTFNVIYAGNIGYVQALETIITTATQLKDKVDLRFVFVGEGSAKPELTEMVSLLHLKNVLFIPYQPRERMSEILGAADVGLVSLKKGTGFGGLPSKTFSILSSETPIIACVDPGSDAWEVIEKSGGGYAIPPENPEKLTEAILNIYNLPDRGASMGKCGRNYVIEFHSPTFAAKKFLELINTNV